MTARPAVMAPPHAAEYAALVDRTRALVPLLAKHADRTEAAGSVVPEVVAALQDAGVFRIVQPRAVGGYEFPATSFFDVCATLARGCMSTAWVVGNLSSHHLLLAHWPVAAQDEVWSASRDTLIGASYVFTAGKVRRVAGGYRVEGQWPYSSGIDPCQWVTIGGLVEPDAPGGAPERRYFLLPRADYEILDTWQTSGLQGTGSKDVLFRDVFVPAHRTVGYDEMVEGRAPGLARHPGGLFRYPIPAGGGYVLLSSMFGAAAGALEAFVAAVKSQSSTSAGQKLAGFTTLQQRVAEAAATLDAVELTIGRRLEDASAMLATAGRVADDYQMLMRRDVAWCARQCTAAIDLLFDAAGGGAIYKSNPLQRAWRDVHAGAANFTLQWDAVGPAWGRVALGLRSGLPGFAI